MRLGEYQKLVVIKKVEFGVYLAERMEDETRVLLPEKQVPEGTKIGDELRVFLYKDSKDRLIATTNTPKLTLGGLAVLTVKEVAYFIKAVTRPEKHLSLRRSPWLFSWLR